MPTIKSLASNGKKTQSKIPTKKKITLKKLTPKNKQHNIKKKDNYKKVSEIFDMNEITKIDKDEAKKVFQQILDSIPNTDRFKKDKMDMALNIYLTWCGIRPACIPYDGFKLRLEANTPEANNIITKINNINGLAGVIGPYYDTGISLVVYNTKFNIMPFLNNIKNARAKKDEIFAKYKNEPNRNKILDNDKSYRKLEAIIHINMGKMLGYQCPKDLPIFYNNPTYGIRYRIKSLKWSLGYWCLVSQKKEILKSLDRMALIRAAFEKIDLEEIHELNLSINIYFA